MIRLILIALGWRGFKYSGVSIWQRRCLVDQTIVKKVVDDTTKKRLWCDDGKLNIFIEPFPFRGIYGTVQSLEVARFVSIFGRKSANIRVCAGSLSYDSIYRAIEELNRDDKAKH